MACQVCIALRGQEGRQGHFDYLILVWSMARDSLVTKLPYFPVTPIDTWSIEVQVGMIVPEDNNFAHPQQVAARWLLWLSAEQSKVWRAAFRHNSIIGHHMVVSLDAMPYPCFLIVYY